MNIRSFAKTDDNAISGFTLGITLFLSGIVLLFGLFMILGCCSLYRGMFMDLYNNDPIYNKAIALYNTGIQSYKYALTKGSKLFYQDAQLKFASAYSECTNSSGLIPDSNKQFAGQIQFMLGNAYEGLEETDNAIEAYKQALRLDPTHLSAKSNLERLLVLDSIDQNIRQGQHGNQQGQHGNQQGQQGNQQGQHGNQQGQQANQQGQQANQQGQQGNQQGQQGNQQGQQGNQQGQQGNQQGQQGNQQGQQGNQQGQQGNQQGQQGNQQGQQGNQQGQQGNQQGQQGNQQGQQGQHDNQPGQQSSQRNKKGNRRSSSGSSKKVNKGI